MALLCRRPTGFVLGQMVRLATSAIPNLHAHVTVRGAAAAPGGKKGKAAAVTKKKVIS
jgi:hypothetical protein